MEFNAASLHRPGGTAAFPAVALLVVVVLVAVTARAADGPPATTTPAPAPTPNDTVADIVVTSEKLTVEKLIDRTTYRIGADAQSTFGSLSDVLGVIPSVDVDPDGIVSLRGDANVLILIDGQPSTQFSGSAAGDNLQSIPARDIERIEILTTPPSQFKADGAAGVINIVTRKQRAAGAAGSVQASLGSGGRSVTGADFSYSGARLTTALTAGYRQDIRDRMLQSAVTSADAATGRPRLDTSLLRERIRREVPTAGVTATYSLSHADSMRASANWADRGGLRTYTQIDSGGPVGAAPTSLSRRLSDGHDPETDLDGKLGYTHQFERKGESLDLALHRSTSRQHERYDHLDEPVLPPGASSTSRLEFAEVHTTTEFGADYTLSVSTSRTLKAGYAFERDDYRYDNGGSTLGGGPGAALPDDFRFRQRIQSAYGSYQATAGAWDWLGGLRAESTRAEARQLTGGDVTPSRYARLYPSLHVDHHLSEQISMTFGASRRVARPDPDTLNPYVDPEYTPNLRAGNPHLRPQDTQSYEAGVGYEGHGRRVGATAYYRRNRDSVTDVTQYLGNGVSLSTKTNLPRNDAAGVEMNAEGHVVRSLAYTVSANLFRNEIDATALGIAGLKSTTGLNAKIKLDYRPTPADSAQLSATRTDRRLTPQGTVGALTLVNVGLRHRFDPHLTAVATVTDVFNGQHFERTAVTPTFTGDYRRSVRGRIVFLGLVYGFGLEKADKSPADDDDPST